MVNLQSSLWVIYLLSLIFAGQTNQYAYSPVELPATVPPDSQEYARSVKMLPAFNQVPFKWLINYDIS